MMDEVEKEDLLFRIGQIRHKLWSLKKTKNIERVSSIPNRSLPCLRASNSWNNGECFVYVGERVDITFACGVSFGVVDERKVLEVRLQEEK